MKDFSKWDWNEWLNTNAIEHAVRETIQQSLDSALHSQGKSMGKGLYFSNEVFETHGRVIAKIGIPRHVQVDHLRLYVNGSQLKIQHHDQKQLIRLPVPVSCKMVRAVLQDHVLQVQMRKQDRSEKFQEIQIHLR